MEDCMNNIDNILVDVRKAYRLLHTFNSRIFDLMKYIESKIEMEYAGGRSVFTDNTPGRWKGSFENWTWDYFNLYFYEFVFESNNSWLSVLLQSDTGLWDKIKDINDEDEFDSRVENIETFNSAENSKTRLFFVTGTGKWKEENIQKLYNKNLNRDIENEIIIPLNKSEKSGKIYCKMFEISNFLDEETTIQSLDNFNDFLKSNDFDKIKILKTRKN
jgi:hypothetical protein